MTTTRKNQLSKIMRVANTLRKSESVSMSDALKMAWKSFKLKVRMATEAVRFTFLKVDGTVREALGTLCSSMMPAYETKGKERKENLSVQCYYDLDKSCFRSFRVSNLIAF